MVVARNRSPAIAPPCLIHSFALQPMLHFHWALSGRITAGPHPPTWLQRNIYRSSLAIAAPLSFFSRPRYRFKRDVTRVKPLSSRNDCLLAQEQYHSKTIPGVVPLTVFLHTEVAHVARTRNVASSESSNVSEARSTARFFTGSYALVTKRMSLQVTLYITLLAESNLVKEGCLAQKWFLASCDRKKYQHV
jgi:hypothetical protein